MSSKHGRNDPCPCGSGKKFKRCCLGKKTMKASEFSNKNELEKNGRAEGIEDFISKAWNLDKLKKMSTEDIIGKLRSMNIRFDIEDFKEQSQGYISAIDLSEECH